MSEIKRHDLVRYIGASGRSIKNGTLCRVNSVSKGWVCLEVHAGKEFECPLSWVALFESAPLPDGVEDPSRTPWVPKVGDFVICVDASPGGHAKKGDLTEGGRYCVSSVVPTPDLHHNPKYPSGAGISLDGKGSMLFNIGRFRPAEKSVPTHEPQTEADILDKIFS